MAWGRCLFFLCLSSMAGGFSGSPRRPRNRRFRHIDDELSENSQVVCIVKLALEVHRGRLMACQAVFQIQF